MRLMAAKANAPDSTGTSLRDCARALASLPVPCATLNVAACRQGCRRSATWFLLLALCAVDVSAAERVFDFGEFHENELPAGFRSAVTGKGKPGDWKIIMDSLPSQLPPLSDKAPQVAKQPVLAQLAQDPTDEHFPLLIFQDDTYSDFTLTTRFKTVKGAIEQMAGLAFRLQDETNYYVVRASSLGNTFRFYKVVNGVRGDIIGPELPIPSGVWHDLTVECKGNQIRCSLDGQELIPMLTDSTFGSGKIAFWTKSDSVSYFAGTRIVYTPHEAPAQAIVREIMNRYPGLLGLKIYLPDDDRKTIRVVASKDPKDIGQNGGPSEAAVIDGSQPYYGKESGVASVVLPLRDRNGDTIAAARVVMKTFSGQTEKTAVLRASTIVKLIQARVQTRQDLVE
jgi:hypothetical protein